MSEAETFYLVSLSSGETVCVDEDASFGGPVSGCDLTGFDVTDLQPGHRIAPPGELPHNSYGSTAQLDFARA